MIAASAQGGNTLWTYQATKSDTGVLAQAAPAFADGLVIAGFESGDIVALRAETGSLAWSDNLGTLKGTASLLEFASGAQVTFLASWDVWRHGVPPIELHGQTGSLRVPDPNWFGGDPEIALGRKRKHEGETATRPQIQHRGSNCEQSTQIILRRNATNKNTFSLC